MPEFNETRDAMNALAQAITELFPSYGFAFLLFEFHSPGTSNYISNAERADMIKALRETADRLESNQDIKPDQQN